LFVGVNRVAVRDLDGWSRVGGADIDAMRFGGGS
jgi:hypothetical protein